MAESVRMEVSGVSRERVMERADISSMGVCVFIRIVIAAVAIKTVSIRVGVVFVVMFSLVCWDVRETWEEVIVVNAVRNWIEVVVFSRNTSRVDRFAATFIIVLGIVSFEVWVFKSVCLWVGYVIELSIAHVDLNSLGGGHQCSSEVCSHGYFLFLKIIFPIATPPFICW